jgi:hypothetical protein
MQPQRRPIALATQSFPKSPCIVTILSSSEINTLHTFLSDSICYDSPSYSGT